MNLKIHRMIIICCSMTSCLPYSIDTHHLHSRRNSLAKAVTSVTAIATLPYAPPVCHAQETHTQSDMSLLKEATEVLTSLLDNWERATNDCTYADVPRELLEAKNKEKLLGGYSFLLAVILLLVLINCSTSQHNGALNLFT